jgi:hypothetical protein
MLVGQFFAMLGAMVNFNMAPIIAACIYMSMLLVSTAQLKKQ